MQLIIRLILLTLAATLLTAWTPLPLFFLGGDPPFQPGKPVEFRADAWFPEFRQNSTVIDNGSMTDHFVGDSHLAEGLEGYQLTRASAIGASYVATGLFVFGMVNRNLWQILGSAATTAICLELLHISDGIILAHDVERYNVLLPRSGAYQRPSLHWQLPQIAVALTPDRFEQSRVYSAATVTAGVGW